LGMTSQNVPKWTFDLKLDKKNRKILYAGAQLVNASYGAGHVQFDIKRMDLIHKILLNLDSLNFTETFADEISTLSRKGRCKRI